ncbi:MAG: pseudouridine synthase [Clostridium sp.]|uniref:pseudouridine synthase n=1 Tax=Clostridium sp. TaxID=1506 RepID=UPI0030219457
MERLDKILGNMGYGSRKEVKTSCRKGAVVVNDQVVKDSAVKVDPTSDVIMVNGERVNYREFIYLLLNKPAGVVSATFDNHDETVIDLLDPEYQVFEPFPVGRLDKDTVGFQLLTNDGALNHKLISPKNHVNKVYYAEINKPVDKSDVESFKKGIVIDDGYKCMPGELEIISSTEDGSEVFVTIQEGKFHQVKRMFEALDKSVVYLKRVKFGPMELDETLEEGSYRELTAEEIEILQNL